MRTILLILFLGILSIDTEAQSRVLFRVDMRPQIIDSTFIPTQHRLEIIGNQPPLTRNNRIQLKDVPPADSIFVAEIRFSSLFVGEYFKYNFSITREHAREIEDQPRLMLLRKGTIQLDLTHYNSFAH